MTAELDAIFKAYDVRGVYPEQIDESAHHREPHAAPREFGGEKWIENPGLHLFRHATATIADLQTDVIAGAAIETNTPGPAPLS